MKGQCMCGAVTFEARPSKMTFDACHCGMCRAWTGSMFTGVHLTPGEFTVLTGADRIRSLASSEWAERAWCDACGGNLYYRVTAEGPNQGDTHLALGTLENPDAFDFESEIFIDRKPGCFAFEGSRPTMTEAEVVAQFASPAEETTQ
ncbi:GFA family protein [Amaricoccus tamworthensis]|uniref:GFA family protein n=1 Tax=Amaricoccus tamworthensis TaxID=57002 RepID=UPI003C7B94C3